MATDRFYKLEEIDLDLPRKKIIYANVKDKIEVPVIKEGEKVRITISGNQDEFKSFKKSEKYKKLVETGVKVVFRPEKIEMKEVSSDVQVSDFDKILKEMVDNTNSIYVRKAYEKVINDKEIDDDIMVLKM